MVAAIKRNECLGCIRPTCVCWFWLEWVGMQYQPEVARIDGEHFFVRPRVDPPHEGLGFGGGEFSIRFFDGRIASTNNLWWQGVIPECFRKLLPDNAVFLDRRPR